MFAAIRVVHQIFLGAILSVPLLAADQPKPIAPPAPLPSQIVNAKTVFISNAGENLYTLPAYIASHTGSPNGLYDQFYAAIKSFGRYELVATPAEADLVLEISLHATDTRDPNADPQFELKVLDPKTRIVLWSFVERVRAGSGREASRDKAWDQALEKLVNDFRNLTLPSSQTAK